MSICPNCKKTNCIKTVNGNFVCGECAELLAFNMKTSRKSSFWIREKKQSNAEVDFIVPYGRHLIPVEVKAGKVGTLRSLHQFIDKSDHPYAVRLYAGQLKKIQTATPKGKSFTLLNMPYFLSGKIKEYIDWMMATEGSK